MQLPTAGQSAASLWDQDLTDILSILGDENNPISSSLSENDLLSILDGGDDQLFSPSQFTGELELRTLQDALSIHNTPSDQTKVQNQPPVMQFQRTLSLATKMESYNSVLLENAEQVGIEQAFLGKDTGTVQNGGTENSTGATPRGVKRPVDNQYREVESTKKETTRGNTHARKKLRNPTQSTNNLFRILGLILQAFKTPLTNDLEEHYIRVLNRALFEIRNAHQFLQQSQGNT
ncbi:unnamed protein product [Porites evermanni]|uniref:Uncharacterized protein n=1 Tax=Porites evermanni TaxID=104178 RepID=A0ABN8RJ60_9CNID|nr:unnamed protein product [Porites evermanni]